MLPLFIINTNIKRLLQNNNNNRHHHDNVTAHSVHLTNAEQCQVATDPQIKPTHLECESHI